MSNATNPLYFGRRFDGVACLVVVSGPGLGKHNTLRSNEVLVGRGQDCDVVLEAPGVSRRHCELHWAAGAGWTVRDLGSTNGTFVDGCAVNAGSPLPTHGTLAIGEAVLTLSTAGSDPSVQAHDAATGSGWGNEWPVLSSRERSAGG